MGVVTLAVVAFLSTLLGGAFALKFQKYLHPIMAFTAGVLLAVVGFEILPEIMDLSSAQGIDPIQPMVALVIGFLLFHILEKLILIHHSHEDQYPAHKHPHVGIFSALALAGHSFMDGVGIGLGFQISPEVGLVVGIAVISHDFCDGINTVTLMLAHGNSHRKSKWLLFLDATTPVLGALSTLFINTSPQFVTAYLGFFAGFLLYIGASDILPEAHSKESSLKLIGLTILGVVFIFLVSQTGI